MDGLDLLLLVLLSAYLFVRLCQNWRPDPWPTMHFQLPRWQAHRGYWVDGIQENTLAAFREAARRGCAMAELDVQLSQDGVPIVFHDDDLVRLAKRKEKVSELTAVQLKDWANAPSLEEVLTDKQSVPYFNVEIKSRSARDQRVALATAEVVKKVNAQSRIIFSSFNPLTLRTLWKELPEVPRALLATDDDSDPDSAIYLRRLWLGGYAHANMLNLDKRMITPALMKRLDERKVPVAAWTVNDNEAAELLMNKGVVSIISDRPSVS
jgi:glycerophosphoryl diester phosphodiesterase